MKTLSVLLYLLITVGYIAVLTHSKTVINYLKECIYLFVCNDWEEEN